VYLEEQANEPEGCAGWRARKADKSKMSGIRDRMNRYGNQMRTYAYGMKYSLGSNISHLAGRGGGGERHGGWSGGEQGFERHGGGGYRRGNWTDEQRERWRQRTDNQKRQHSEISVNSVNDAAGDIYFQGLLLAF
jgi:hypothetical protein